MTKVLMVCLGNICRSPLAEGILKSKILGSNVFVDSAGTGAYHVGEQPDTRSIAIANSKGIDIADQKARKFTVKDFDLFDVIYVMDNSNYKNVISLARNNQDASKVKLILNEVFPNENLDVPDPYYGGEFGFKNVYNMLNEACEVIAKKIN
ncbi:low molecular weight phosphotyrosine protein phosphatase [Lutibacter sp. A64]|uniref:low molecular weight protein-tyrosine-phosphatase n=1 Tax=Lutibacter sp. A64 TaxID=2918526 RepID=UPI001F05809D|nr:low molecular weight protein-tyrosine-phosphatase [Lutibacter sp. A64]UMB53886.1 low molecular weight phosphotyrosine protein phosphatase [Lutibacter sp. A64]